MTAPLLWTAADALAATAGSGAKDWRASGLSIDSRTLEPGDLFIALEGPNFDGHDFVAEAFAKGAAAAMVHRRPSGDAAGGPLLIVENTLAALQALGSEARRRSEARVIGLTGTAGKTGTKEALRHCLSAQSACFASPGSLNNHWGVPLSLARLPHSSQYAIFEMGMNHAGEIRALTALVRPHVAVITNIGVGHIAFFESPEAIADAKSEIFEGMASDGVAVLPRDSVHYERLVLNAERAGVTQVVSFGRHAEAEVRPLIVNLSDKGSIIDAQVGDDVLRYDLPLPGIHWVTNTLAVLAAVKAVGANLSHAAYALSHLHPMKGRGARSQARLADGGRITVIDESYNANPLSVTAALAVLANSETGAKGRRIAVLGDMLELGKETLRYHAELANAVVERDIDLVYCCGPAMAALYEALPAERRGGHAADSKALCPELLAALAPGDTVLVKGSLGSRMALIVEALLAQPTAAPAAGSDA
jgi:UDP-N-acetylmuramoyl-tripeptide--D-alanyl-D-alanine ligase